MDPESSANVELINHRVVAVDGGTATGKGRLIDELARLLRLKGVPVVHLSTGSIYRGVTVAALESARKTVMGRRKLSDAEVTEQAVVKVKAMAPLTLLKLAQERQVEMHGGVVWLDGQPASLDGQLKAPGVGNAISAVSSHPEVRELINALTRRQVNEFDGYLLIDGRDITHTVVPGAPLKLLLTVAPAVAAERSQEHNLDEIIARDKADRSHKHGALRGPDDPGENVIVLATDSHTPESARDHVYELMLRVFPELPAL